MFGWNTLIYFFVLGIIGWFTYKVYIWPYYVSPMRNIPGPPSEHPFYGSFKSIFMEGGGEIQVKWAKKYGTVYKIHEIFNRPAIVVADAKSIQEVTLNNVYDYHKRLGDIVRILGDGLITAEGKNHKRQRKMMNPAFAHSIIKEMIPSFTRVALTLKGLIEDKVNIGESRINLSPYISKTTLDVIGLVGFNYEFNSLTSKNELADAYNLVVSNRTGLDFLVRILTHYIPYVRKIPIYTNKKYNYACEVVDRVSRNLVEEKYKNVKPDENDLLSLLININKTLPTEERLTDNELRNQVMTFLLAGHETTNTTICWALYKLATHPHDQDLLREELVKAFPDKSKFNPTFDEINSLEYLNCVTKETLRLDTPVPATSRINTKDKNIGGYFIPKDTLIIISMMTLHRSPSIWGPTADEFDPKRWLNPKEEFKSNFIPFLNGARTCIGNKVALNEFKVILSMLIRNFVFKPVEGFNITKHIGPKPHPHLELIVSKVEG